MTILQEELIRAGVLSNDYDFETHKELVPMQPGDIIINDDPDRAAKELAAIMLAERCKAEGRMHFLREAIEE